MHGSRMAKKVFNFFSPWHLLEKGKKKSIFLFVNLGKTSAFSVNWEPLPNQVEGDQFK